MILIQFPSQRSDLSKPTHTPTPSTPAANTPPSSPAASLRCFFWGKADRGSPILFDATVEAKKDEVGRICWKLSSSERWPRSSMNVGCCIDRWTVIFGQSSSDSKYHIPRGTYHVLSSAIFGSTPSGILQSSFSTHFSCLTRCIKISHRIPHKLATTPSTSFGPINTIVILIPYRTIYLHICIPNTSTSHLSQTFLL